MAKQPADVKASLANHYSKLFSIENGELCWSPGFHLFLDNPEGQKIAMRHFSKLSTEEKNENFVSFVHRYIERSLTTNFNDEIAIQHIFYILHLEIYKLENDLLIDTNLFSALNKQANCYNSIFLDHFDTPDKLPVVIDHHIHKSKMTDINKDQRATTPALLLMNLTSLPNQQSE